MAAMAPALTEAATEAHHRFKLATPSSSLSPSGTTDTDNNNSINNGAIRKSFAEDHSLDFRNNSRKEVLSPRCCFDGGSRPPSTPESVKLQGSLSKHGIIKSHTVLSHSLLEASVLGSDIIDGQVAVEFSPKLIKTMNAGNSYPSLSPPPEPPVNGLAKKSGNPHSVYDLNVIKTGQKSGSIQHEDFSKLACIMSSKITEEDVAGESRKLRHLSTIDEDLHTSELARHLEFGEKDISNFKSMSSPDFSDGVSGSTDSARDLSASRIDTFKILDTEVHRRTSMTQTRQSEIRRRAYKLRKRLEVVQVKQVERHVQQQLGGFVEKTLHHLSPLNCLKRQDVSQQNNILYGNKSGSISWKGDKSASETLENVFKSSSMTKGLEKFISSCDSKLRFSEDAFDSDVTESSSGGESDIEEESQTNVETKQYLAPLRQCAEWRWAVERAAIVSRWNWLQAHVSDLEYRIRQQTDIYRQIRANKGSVVLGDVPPLEDCSPDREECPSLTERKAHGAGGNVEMSVCEHSSLPRNAGKQVIAAVHPVENVTSSTPTEPTKTCCHSRPVNGIVNSVHSLLPDSNSADSSDAEERLNKKQRLNTLSVSCNTTCTAARVRPLLACKKRRLIRPNNIQPLNQKNQHPLTVKCNCNLTTSCIMCGSKNSESRENQYNMPMSERLALLDACLHPVLSFCDDIPLNLYLQPILKGYPQNKSLDKSKASKKLMLKHKGLSASCLSDPTQKAQQKLTNSILASAKYVHNRNRTEKPLKQHCDDFLSDSKFENANVQEKFLNKRRQREPSSEAMEARQALSDMGSTCSSTVSCHSSSHNQLLRPLSSSESSAPSLNNTHTVASTLQAIRKRRGENSFDINNIVIPMSVAATTRVEKLQYKEILTPSWRVVDLKADLINNRSGEEEHEEMEDLSDAAFSSRHTKYEEFERSRWTTWLASPVHAQRRGSRSYKSTDEHSTPHPASPDVSYPSFADLTLSGSPSSPSAPPVNPETNYFPVSQENVARISNDGTRCSTPDVGHEEQTVQPWEKRKFPLSGDPGTEREIRPATGHRQTRNSRRSSGGSNRGSRELESGGLATVQHDDKQKHSISLRLSHR
ncbi:KAT8 regulatory NSL complex subunit 1-like [Mobula hypostoma]|uniref:KAT8 regulatory NSL complex subunit 1-like n=1 Tax=Mobula hypostoma TaxID=723540 RepID=UPI002FC340AB